VAIVFDTLNRSLQGSESSDEDMSAYVRAAASFVEAFTCAVVIVHHCGVDNSRLRGHTSLSGALDAELAVTRDGANNIALEVKLMKDGPQGDTFMSRLEVVEVGVDEDGDPITSCVVIPVEGQAAQGEQGPNLTKNQKTMFEILHTAGNGGLTLDDWNEKARSAGIGNTRKADLYDLRQALKSKGLAREFGERWIADR
jgi:hypothetical protein